jgi:predicted metallo-beta-lactamase superfamily hydrolase
MTLEIIGAESLGVRSLCCLVTLSDRRIVIDPGVSLGYIRHGLMPHPLQVAVGRRVREKILLALRNATDVVFSHFHGDHVPMTGANPYQLAVGALPSGFRDLRCWSKSGDDLSSTMRKRFRDMADLLGNNMQIAEGRSHGPMSFSCAVPHGARDNSKGTVMMTHIEMESRVFVHASDIQLLDDTTVDQLIDWHPDIVLAAGPPLYLEWLSDIERKRAWDNAVRLAYSIETLILDHHLMRSQSGAAWLEELSSTVSRQVFCAADYMDRPRRLLEAERTQLYEKMPVPDRWHEDYAEGRADPDEYLDSIGYQGARF